jgi:hypothetical protein
MKTVFITCYGVRRPITFCGRINIERDEVADCFVLSGFSLNYGEKRYDFFWADRLEFV